MTISISRTSSSRKQACKICGREIPARTESIKTTKTVRGAHSLTDTWYTCMECELTAAAKEATK